MTGVIAFFLSAADPRLHLRSSKRCAYGDCTKRHRDYLMGWDLGGSTVWGLVCADHDRDLGRRNLMRAFDIPKGRVAEYDLALDRAAKEEDLAAVLAR